MTERAEDVAPRRRGRPKSSETKGPKGGKGSNLLTRVTQETRSSLEAEAERTGRSLSQVAEKWLDEARTGHASVEALLGGVTVAPMIRSLIQFARLVESEVGDPGRDPAALAALTEGWSRLIRNVPRAELSAEELKLARESAQLQSACEALLPTVPDEDPARTVLSQVAEQGVVGRPERLEQLQAAIRGWAAHFKPEPGDFFQLVQLCDGHRNSLAGHLGKVADGAKLGANLARLITSEPAHSVEFSGDDKITVGVPAARAAGDDAHDQQVT